MKKIKLLSLAAAALFAVSPIASVSTSTAQKVQASKESNFKKACKNHTLITNNGSKIHFDKIVKYKTISSDPDGEKTRHSTDLMIYGSFYNNGKKTVKNIPDRLREDLTLTLYPNTKKYQHYLSNSAKFFKKITPKNAHKYDLDKWKEKNDKYNLLNNLDYDQIRNSYDDMVTVNISDPYSDNEDAEISKSISYNTLLDAPADKYKNKIKPHETKDFCVVLYRLKNANHKSFIVGQGDYRGDYTWYRKCFTMNVSENRTADFVSLANKIAAPYQNNDNYDVGMTWMLVN